VQPHAAASLYAMSQGKRMTKLYVGQLLAEITSDELHQLFSSKGFSVTSARVICDREGGRSRGFGFVEFGSQDDAERAIEELNGMDVRGRKIVVKEAGGDRATTTMGVK
jgi:RNA recognition motif-containing protein